MPLVPHSVRTTLLSALAVIGAWCVFGAQAAQAVPPLPPAFTEVPGSSFSTGGNPGIAAFNPSGRLLATANGNSTVSVFSVAGRGYPTPVPGSPFTVGQSSNSVAFSPNGALLAVADYNADQVDVLAVSPSGTLTPVSGSPFSAGPPAIGPFSVAFSPGGGLLAVSNYGTNAHSVSVFAVAAGGGLTAAPGSPFDLGAGNNPFEVVFSPDGGLLATANATGNTISLLSVAADGQLTQVTGSPYSTGAGSEPLSVAFSPTGGFVATADSPNTPSGGVSVFSVAAAGGLTQVSGSPFLSGRGTRSVAFAPSGLLAAANYFAGNVSVFSMAADGTLTPIAGSRFSTSSYPTSVAFRPNSSAFAVTELFSGLALFAGGAPVAHITSPATGATFALNQTVNTSFDCSDPSGAPGIASCGDSGTAVGTADLGSGSTGSGPLDTSTLGVHTYTVTAMSLDGLSSTAEASYTVVPAPAPVSAATPAVPSTPAAPPVSVPGPVTATAPLATGRLTHYALGLARLGMTRAQAQTAYYLSAQRSSADREFFSLTPRGVRVGYASSELARTLPAGARSRVRGTVVLALTANPYYALSSVRPGAKLVAARQRLGAGHVFQVGLNRWYLRSYGSWTAVLKIRQGTVQEIGIASAALTRSRSAQRTFISSFG